MRNNNNNSNKVSAQKLVLVPYNVYTQNIMESEAYYNPAMSMEDMEGVVESTSSNDYSTSKLLNSVKDNKNIVKLISTVNRAPVVDTPEYERIADESRQFNDNTANIVHPEGNNSTMMTANETSFTDYLAGNDTQIHDTPKNRVLMDTLLEILESLGTKFHTHTGIKMRRSIANLNWILDNERVTIDPHTQIFVIDRSVESAINVVDFLYSLQSPTKNISDIYVNFIRLIKIPKSLIINIKGILAASTNLKTANTLADETLAANITATTTAAAEALSLGSPIAESTPRKTATIQNGRGASSSKPKGKVQTQRVGSQWLKAF